MLRHMDDVIRDVEAERWVQWDAEVYQQVHALWRCDRGCPANNDQGACWKNSAQQHFKLMVPSRIA
jgi:hypothetical protein